MRDSEAYQNLVSEGLFRVLVLNEIYCGFAVLGDFLRDFSVSNRPLCALKKQWKLFQNFKSIPFD